MPYQQNTIPAECHTNILPILNHDLAYLCFTRVHGSTAACCCTSRKVHQQRTCTLPRRCTKYARTTNVASHNMQIQNQKLKVEKPRAIIRRNQTPTRRKGKSQKPKARTMKNDENRKAKTTKTQKPKPRKNKNQQPKAKNKYCQKNCTP